MDGESRQGPGADRKVIDRKRQQLVADRVLEETVLRGLMGDRQGRRYIWLQLAKMNVFSQTIVFGPGGHAASAFNEGKRVLGLELIDLITKKFPTAYLQMTTENSGVNLEIENDGNDSSPDYEPS